MLGFQERHTRTQKYFLQSVIQARNWHNNKSRSGCSALGKTPVAEMAFGKAGLMDVISNMMRTKERLAKDLGFNFQHLLICETKATPFDVKTISCSSSWFMRITWYLLGFKRSTRPTKHHYGKESPKGDVGLPIAGTLQTDGQLVPPNIHCSRSVEWWAVLPLPSHCDRSNNCCQNNNPDPQDLRWIRMVGTRYTYRSYQEMLQSERFDGLTVNFHDLLVPWVCPQEVWRGRSISFEIELRRMTPV